MNRRKIDEIFLKIKSIMDIEMNLMDLSGYVIKSTNIDKNGEYDLQFKGMDLKKGIIEKEGYLYFFYRNRYIVSIKAIDNQTKKLAEILEFFLTQDFDNLSQEEYIKDILLRRISESELMYFDKTLHINLGEKMQVIVIKVKRDIVDEVESLMAHIYPNNYFIQMNENLFVFIKNSKDEWQEYETNIYESIYSELFYEPKIGIGTIVHDIKDLALSYEKGMQAIELGDVFFNHREICYYKKLGIPVLIQNMNMKDLKEFKKDMHYEIEEVLTDKELVMTILCFFENNLNISETSRKIFIHRNTLIYRLNKIYKLTGYDLRKFEDAMNFKVAMFIYDYLVKDK